MAAASTGRIVLTALAGAALFVGLATLFATLLRPLAPAQAARADYAGQEGAVIRKPTHEADLVAPMDIIREDELDARTQPIPESEQADAAPLPDGPVVAILMTELGPNAASSRRAIDALPPGISFTFSPYADAAPALARRARADGHEVFVSVPMEPQRYPRVSPGKNTLLRSASADENVERLEWALDRFDDPDGATGMMGSAFTEDAAALRPVMRTLHLRGLAYVDARASRKSVAERTARDNGVPSRSNDRFLDEPASAENIRTNVDALIATARRRGYAIGYARPTPATIAALSGFEARAEQAGVTLVGAARLARGLPDDR